MVNSDFKIHSICLIKNEADIIECCIQAASVWSDYIYIFDNGSTDSTWEKVRSLRSDKIIPWKQDDKPFKEALRGEVFNTFQDRAKPGDWWCRLDADEFYLQSPRAFMAGVPRQNHVVWGIAIEYYLTHKDIAEVDFDQPLKKLLHDIHYYKVENSETRFFRHRRGLIWGEDDSWPQHVGLVNPHRIAYKHYKYRTPEQIQKRLYTRQQARERGFPGWDHADEYDWTKKLAAASDLRHDQQDDPANIDDSGLPNHMEPAYRRLLKHFMHGVGLWP